jgi:hypothetical protein
MKFDERNPKFFERIGRTNFVAVAMEIKKGGFKKNLISFIKLHEIS